MPPPAFDRAQAEDCPATEPCPRTPLQPCLREPDWPKTLRVDLPLVRHIGREIVDGRKYHLKFTAESDMSKPCLVVQLRNNTGLSVWNDTQWAQERWQRCIPNHKVLRMCKEY
jgi:hypothetical protein